MKGWYTFFFVVFAVGLAVGQPSLTNQTVLDGRVELKIPSDFTLMTPEIINLKYPSQNRPNVVYTNTTGGSNVAFSWTTNKAQREIIPQYKNVIKQSFQSKYPKAEWISDGVLEINGQSVGYLELITPALDTPIYNLLFFTDLDGKLLLCTFNCTVRFQKEWEPVAKEIMNSLLIKK
jgi:hypothetical protein